MKVTLGQASVDAISVSIASLVKGALSAMIIEKLKWAGFAASSHRAGARGSRGDGPARRAKRRAPRAPPTRHVVDNRQTAAEQDPPIDRQKAPPIRRAPRLTICAIG